jgi:hypothetical protein
MLNFLFKARAKTASVVPQQQYAFHIICLTKFAPVSHQNRTCLTQFEPVSKITESVLPQPFGPLLAAIIHIEGSCCPNAAH